MSKERGMRGVVARIRRLLPRGDWVYLASLLVPLFLFNVTLKVVRIVTLPTPPGPFGFVDQIRSDLLFNLGFAALWVGAFALARSGWLRVIVLILFHLSVVVVVALSTSAHFFYESTGSTLNLSFVIVSLSSLGEIQGAIGSETTTLQWLGVSVGLFYALAGPALVTRLATGDWASSAARGGVSGRGPALVGLTAVVLFSLSITPSLTNAGNAFARDPVANMVVNEVANPEVEVKVDPDVLPTDTSLVATPETKKRNIALIFFESTRARSTTPYNEDLATTPFLDELADQSILAERAHAVVPHTSKALVATTCGVPPPLDTNKTESEPNILPGRCLPELLGEQGYKSAFFQSATGTFENRPELVANFGYDHFQAIENMPTAGFQRTNYFGYEDDIMLGPSRQWLEQNADDGPFITSYLTVTAHHQYVVPARYGSKQFSNDPERPGLNRYLNAVRYQDFFLRNLIQQYKDLGLYEDTIFVILGDHGEGFAEHRGLMQHDNTIYEEGLHIPFVIHDPQNPEPRRVEENVSELDTLPTLTDMLGFEIRGGHYPGYSMLSPPANRTLRSSCYQEQTCLASLDGDQKYIYSYGNRGEELFDLSKDPMERRNLIEEQPEAKVEALREDLLAWQARVDASYEERRERRRTTSSSSSSSPE